MKTLLICAAVAALAGTSFTAGADARPQRAGFLECDELLSNKEAAEAANEPVAEVVRNDKQGSTQDCIWIAGSKTKGAVVTLEVTWSTYADFRRTNLAKGRKLVCLENVAACDAYDVARTVKSESDSFRAFFAALDLVGRARWLAPSRFGGNRAFVWEPGDNLAAKFGRSTRVFVYHAPSRRILEIYCSRNEGTTVASAEFDEGCAIAAAKTAYYNVTN